MLWELNLGQWSCGLRLHNKGTAGASIAIKQRTASIGQSFQRSDHSDLCRDGAPNLKPGKTGAIRLCYPTTSPSFDAEKDPHKPSLPNESIPLSSFLAAASALLAELPLPREFLGDGLLGRVRTGGAPILFNGLGRKERGVGISKRRLNRVGIHRWRLRKWISAKRRDDSSESESLSLFTA